jgi:hypothetical protein
MQKYDLSSWNWSKFDDIAIFAFKLDILGHAS